MDNKIRNARSLTLEMNDWHYSKNCFSSKLHDNEWEGKSININGKTKKVVYLDTTDCRLFISITSSNGKSDEYKKEEFIFGDLARYGENFEGDIPPFVGAKIHIQKNDFMDLKNNLVNWSLMKNASFFISLHLYGLDLSEYFGGDDKWPDDKKLEIVRFGYTFRSWKDQ